MPASRWCVVISNFVFTTVRLQVSSEAQSTSGGLCLHAAATCSGLLCPASVGRAPRSGLLEQLGPGRPPPLDPPGPRAAAWGLAWARPSPPGGRTASRVAPAARPQARPAPSVTPRCPLAPATGVSTWTVLCPPRFSGLLCTIRASEQHLRPPPGPCPPPSRGPSRCPAVALMAPAGAIGLSPRRLGGSGVAVCPGPSGCRCCDPSGRAARGGAGVWSGGTEARAAAGRAAASRSGVGGEAAPARARAAPPLQPAAPRLPAGRPAGEESPTPFGGAVLCASEARPPVWPRVGSTHQQRLPPRAEVLMRVGGP